MWPNPTRPRPSPEPDGGKVVPVQLEKGVLYLKRIAFLEKKIQTKDEVLAELMAEHVGLKKDIGEL